LPLYQGSRIAAERRQAEYELARLKLTFEQQADIVEAAALSSLSEATASRLTIDFAKASADAAQRTLSLVTDSYVRGASNYIDLIDAQSAYLAARLTSSSADFQHLQDLIELQRSIGYFDFYVSAIEEDAWFDALSEFERTYEQQR
ncbi:MAG: TolC family protein, partial [Pseudomonadota bacterium]